MGTLHKGTQDTHRYPHTHTAQVFTHRHKCILVWPHTQKQHTGNRGGPTGAAQTHSHMPRNPRKTCVNMHSTGLHVHGTHTPAHTHLHAYTYPPELKQQPPRPCEFPGQLPFLIHPGLQPWPSSSPAHPHWSYKFLPFAPPWHSLPGSACLCHQLSFPSHLPWQTGRTKVYQRATWVRRGLQTPTTSHCRLLPPPTESEEIWVGMEVGAG